MKHTLVMIFGMASFSLSAYAQVPMSPEDQYFQMTPETRDVHAYSDAEIIAVVKNTDDEAIAAAREEKNRGKSEAAKSLATQVMDQHAKTNKNLSELEKKLKMHPVKTAMSDKIHSDEEKTVSRLDKMNGADLDRAYAEKQVEMQKRTLDKLETVLIPQAKNEDLRDLLQETHEAIAERLAHAEEVQQLVDGKVTSVKQ